MGGNTMRLNVMGFAFAFAVWWALSVFIVGILATFGGYGAGFVELFGTVYIGFAATFMGTIVGTIWALIDGFIGGLIFAWLYNFFSGKCCCPSKCKSSDDSDG